MEGRASSGEPTPGGIVKTNSIAQLLEDPGPFASVYVDVSRDMEDGNRVVELAARAACDSLLEQGAPSSVCDEIRDVLTTSLHVEAPPSRAAHQMCTSTSSMVGVGHTCAIST